MGSPIYKNHLKNGNSLEVYNGSSLIFESRGKWLNPLFELEEFLCKKNESDKESCVNNCNYEYSELSVHDTAIGKAAVVLLIKLGVRRIYGNIVSRLALSFVENYNKQHNKEDYVELSWDSLVERLMCATETELADINNLDQIYMLVRQRAKRVCGVDIAVNNISYRFGNINNLTFSVKAGGHLMVLGENGAGKSTLLRILVGIYKPITGNVIIEEKQISSLPKYTIGYIPQQTDCGEYSLSVEEVTGLGIPGHIFGKKRKERITKALERTSALHLAGRNFSSLSGGEKQKVSLARCLAQNAKLLLLDEPTAALDSENRNMVVDIVKSLSVNEMPTIIISTHDSLLSQMDGWSVLNLDKKGENNV